MSDGKDVFIDQVDMDELVRVHGFTALVFHLCGRVGREINGRSTGLSGAASPEYSAYTQACPGEEMFSLGFLYDEASVQAMKDAGFPIRPAIATSIAYGAPVYMREDDGRIVSHFNDAVRHPLREIAAYFAGMNVRSFIVSGGSFPGEVSESAIVIDVNDPDFVAKVKAEALSLLPYEAVKSLSRPQRIETAAEYIDYSRAVLLRLQEYAEKNGAAGFRAPVVKGVNDRPCCLEDISTDILMKADHQLHWTTGVLDPLTAQMDAGEIGDVLNQIAHSFVRSATFDKNLVLAARQAGPQNVHS